MRGRCLCGEVEFELLGEMPKMYQCHCSLCRRVSGSSANAALIVDAAQFRWCRGDDRVSEYESPGGFKSHFCMRCGSPLPNPARNGSAWWVPAGLLDDRGELELAAHFYVASRASWDLLADTVPRYDEMPAGADLDGLLRREKTVT